MGGRRQQLDGALHAVVECERLGGQHELAGLDLGEVEDLVDQQQQRVRGLVDGAEIGLLLGGRAWVSASRPAMPMMPFIGVRISWLIAARKRDLARSAASAWSRAPASSAWAALASVMSLATIWTSAGSPFIAVVRSVRWPGTGCSSKASQRGPDAVSTRLS